MIIQNPDQAYAVHWTPHGKMGDPGGVRIAIHALTSGAGLQHSADPSRPACCTRSVPPSNSVAASACCLTTDCVICP